MRRVYISVIINNYSKEKNILRIYKASSHTYKVATYIHPSCFTAFYNPRDHTTPTADQKNDTKEMKKNLIYKIKRNDYILY